MFSLRNRRVNNKDVQFNTRLVKFTTPPIQTGDLIVDRDLYVSRNTYLNNLNISGDLTVAGNTSLQTLQVADNVDISGSVLSYGTIHAEQYLPGQIVNVVMLDMNDLGQTVKIIGSGITDTIFLFTYYPKIANSYLLIEYQTSYSLVGGASDSMYAYLNVYDSDNHRISTTYQQWNNAQGGGTRSGTIFPIVGRYTNEDTTSKTIRVDVYNHTDADNVTIQSNDSTWLKITEIGREIIG